MLLLPSFGASASRFILQQSIEGDLLEEVDEDDLLASAVAVDESRSPYRTALLTSFSVLLLAFCASISPRVSCALIGVLLVAGFLLYFFAKWRLRLILRTTKELESAAQRANRALLQREALSFGLGLPSSRLHSSCRLRLFLCCRDSVHLLTDFADQLVSEAFMDEEKRRLVKSFYTEEMRELLCSPADLDSSHITQRGIGTLLDLFVLHRSEVLRLVVLYLSRSPFRAGLALLARLVFAFTADLNARIARFDDLRTSLSRKCRDRAKFCSYHDELKCQDGLEKIVFLLDDIIKAIVDEQLSAAEVKRALQRVLSMEISEPGMRSDTARIPSSSDKDYSEQAADADRAAAPGFSPGAPLRDEVFEVMAAPDDADDGDVGSMVDDEGARQHGRQLMEELRSALAGRATEFAARERRALAAFYGVSDDELERIEKANDAAQGHAGQDEEFTSGCGRTDNDGADELSVGAAGDRRLAARSLPSDLLAALRLRSVAEETIGDE